jgi:hypothetical protein
LGIFFEFSTGPFSTFFFLIERESLGESIDELGFSLKLRILYILPFELFKACGFTDGFGSWSD